MPRRQLIAHAAPSLSWTGLVVSAVVGGALGALVVAVAVLATF